MAALVEVPDRESEPTTDRSRRYDGIGVGLALVAVVFALQLLRQQGNPSWLTIWAEDGKYYSTEAITNGGLRSLFRST